MATAYISSATDLALVNTTARPGVLMMPETNDQLGRILTFKDVAGTFARSTITFSTLLGDTFEDGSIRQTYSDTYGAYSFVADTNKWFLVGGPRMNSATISTLTTQTLNVQAISTQQVVASTITLSDTALVRSSQSLYSDNRALFFGSNAWGGARTAVSLRIPVAPSYSFTGRMVATGGSITTVTVGSTVYTVHAFASSATSYAFTVTKPGPMEIVLVSRGGAGGAGRASLGGGGGGSGNYFVSGTGMLDVGRYTVTAGISVAIPTEFVDSGGYVYFSAGLGGGSGGSGLYGVGGSNAVYASGGQPGADIGTGASGGGGAGIALYGGDGGSGSAIGGTGGLGATIPNFLTGGTIVVCGGGGGGGGGTTGASGPGGGNGGNGGAAGASGSAATTFGGGGGGGGAGTTTGGTASLAVVWIRYTSFTYTYS
jgi:hypothetical protein